MRWITISLHHQEETNKAKNNAGHWFGGREYLRLLITDLNTFWISFISMTELRGLRAWSKLLRGSRREGIIRFNASFHCFRSSRYYVSSKAEKQIIIFSNNLLFHFSELLFHLLKIISCSKQWKDQKAI